MTAGQDEARDDRAKVCAVVKRNLLRDPGACPAIVEAILELMSEARDQGARAMRDAVLGRVQIQELTFPNDTQMEDQAYNLAIERALSAIRATPIPSAAPAPALAPLRETVVTAAVAYAEKWGHFADDLEDPDAPEFRALARACAALSSAQGSTTEGHDPSETNTNPEN